MLWRHDQGSKNPIVSKKIIHKMATLAVKNKSPVLTIKRAGPIGRNGQWQDFIDREQSSVDHLLRDSFATFCKDLKDNNKSSNNNSNSNKYHHTIGGYKVRKKPSSPEKRETAGFSSGSSPESSPNFRNYSGDNENMGSRTLPRLPRSLFKDSEDSDGLHLPPGIQELESLYAPMKNLSRPLPSALNYPQHETMPHPHPLSNWNELNVLKSMKMLDDDQESEICSVIIPPPLPPIQSHAILEKSLGHEILVHPRTPANNSRTPKFSNSSSISSSSSSATAPALPRRISSKLSLVRPLQRPNQLTVNTIYANTKTMMLNRSSLMSTGSSEESSGSSGMPEEALSPVTASTTSSEAVFSWPNYSVNCSPSPSAASSEDHEHRSVSQIGEPSDSASEASEAYVKMSRGCSSEATYMNVIYNAVQRQGGRGSVEDAISPYIDMTTSTPNNKTASNVKMLPNANIDAISSIYARPQSITSSGGSSRATPRRKSSTRRSKSETEFKYLMAEVTKKRLFRVGLNMFNSRPENGIEYLVQKGFMDLSSESVGKFLHTTNGLSMEKIGEYLGNLQSPFAMKVLSCFMQEFNFSDLRIDKSLRKLLQHLRVPGEAQKIEKIMEVFGKRYGKCNPSFITKIKAPDSIVTLAFAIMLLNTDLHTPNIKVEKKMTVQDFITNLKGVDGGRDFDPKLLKQIYKGIKKQEFVSGIDHVVQTQALQQSILTDQGKPMSLVQPHRRLVCLCRLSEVVNINSRKEPSAGSHQRDLFLFNDLLVVCKNSNKSSKNNPMYAHRDSFNLSGLEVTLFHTPIYNHGIQVSRKSDGDVLVTLNAGSEHDRYKFVMDLQESIFEMDQMDSALKNLSR